MKIVVDSNVVASGLINKTGKIGQLLIFGRRQFQFFAPNLLKAEIKKHQQKLIEASKLTVEEFDTIREELYECLLFISEEQLSFEWWQEAIPIVREVDMDDIAFVALSNYLDSKLWTGDKILLAGIRKKGFTRGISTDELFQIWMNPDNQ